jgi:DNA-binding transcriptional MerR regulator
MRIGELSARTGLTSRTIRYYEEVGLLVGEGVRGKGQHRQYDEADVDHLLLITALSTLLGLPLEEVRSLVRPELVRATSDERWAHIETMAERLNVVETALSTVKTIQVLVRSRREQLEMVERDLERRLTDIESRPVVGA